MTPTPSVTPPPPTPTREACLETEGILFEAAFASAYLEAEVTYRIYFPPCYLQTQGRYPYVILLHGLEAPGQTPMTSQQWIDLGIIDALERGIVQGRLPPMVLVMPDGGQAAASNVFGRDESYENVILEEMIPALESEGSGYCLWGAPQGRVIAGISRGGFWAFEIAFRHPGVFSAVAGHSPFFDPQVPEAYDPIALAASQPAAELNQMRIMFDHGAADYVQADVQRFFNALRNRQIEHDYIVNPSGEHNDAYWSSHVAEYLDFYGFAWPRDPYELPGCLEPLR
ncbi:MAG: alpha/beta hydrolase-fold protein [Anaerolineae bacterium]|nr:alpha/beta hydrolase-fold protein [Anaerolineae bacterium]